MAWRRKRDADDMSGTEPLDDDQAVSDELIADDAVLDELSRAFALEGDDESSAPPSAASSAAPSRATISIGGDDDLPDLAYLDDELERDSSASKPVFIDDDGGSDAVSASDASTTNRRHALEASSAPVVAGAGRTRHRSRSRRARRARFIDVRRRTGERHRCRLHRPGLPRRRHR
jgi:hypothetical protein